MEFADVVRKRRMVRHFTSEPVAEATVKRIVSMAQRAPSAGFSQGVVFVAVTDEATRKRVGEISSEETYVNAGFDPFISEAPVQIIICTSEQIYHDRYKGTKNRRGKTRSNGRSRIGTRMLAAP